MLFLIGCFCFILFIIIGFDADCLIMVAKILSKQGTAAAISGILRYFKTESDIAVIVNVKILYRYIGELLGAIHKSTLIIDDQGLEQTILVQCFRPPCR